MERMTFVITVSQTKTCFTKSDSTYTIMSEKLSISVDVETITIQGLISTMAKFIL